ncbi:uncharacterized protein LOC128676346 [Plodia interpunctella]|uniref:uncharacterized protein LOC128676346 n=1 Tax=Plodia interpunctella TaxID=58824 RepID=UPI00236877DE|nr:uncharacterized protein LOC128676346 [Plodia interpunctella]
MDTKCNGCDKVIYDICYMECSREKCMKLYHLKCLGIAKEAFDELTQEQKVSWICPECVCSNPKRGNSDTPVRTSVLNKIFTPSYVNTERGSRPNQADISLTYDEMRVAEELRELRVQMDSRFDVQMNAYKQLQDRFCKSEIELQEIRKQLTVAQEKSSTVEALENIVKSLQDRNKYLEACLVEKDKQAVETLNDKKQLILATKEVAQRKSAEVEVSACVATKSTTDTLVLEPIIINSKTKSKDRNNDLVKSMPELINKDKDDWVQVTKRKGRYHKTEVKKGGSVNILDIQGTEKKKYLHVWRLKKETTKEAMETYVKKICGQEVPVQIEKITPKTDRDYSSFMVGVPERFYEKLCQSDVWPINVEYSEWIFFRRPSNKSRVSS